MSEFIPNGALIGRYRILAPIGQGGMATVYKVNDTVLERDVALKLIRIDQFPPAILDIVLKRFEREAKALARLNHPNIVKIHDYGEHENAPYLVMDYLPGQSFKQIRKPVLYKTAIHLIRPIADALAYAHENGIFHRDVKPGNIMLTAKGMPVLTDFGIAKLLDTNEGHTLTASGVGIGTPEYMAPEQGFGDEIDGRADQYALAIVLYELITAHKPFQGNTPMAVIYKQYNDPLPPMRESAPDVPASVEVVIQKALSKLPDQRFPDMTSFARALEDAILPGVSQITVAPQPTQTDTPIFDSQPRPDSDTVPVMPFNTGANSKVKSHPTTPSKQKPQLASWMVPLALLIVVGAIFVLQRTTTDSPMPKPSETVPISSDTPILKPTETIFLPTDTTEPIPTETPVSPVRQTQLAFAIVQTESAQQATNAQLATLSQEQTATAEQAQADELAALDATMNAFYQTETAVRWTPTSTVTLTPTATFTPTVSPTPTVPVEFATVSDFLEKRQYARLGAYIRGIANPTLKEQLKQFVYEELFDGEISLRPYQDCNGKYGYINTLGEIVIEPQFYGAEIFSEGLARIEEYGKKGYGYVNTLGEIIVEPQFDDAENFSNGLALIKKKNQYGYINTSGEVVVEPRLDEVHEFSEGLAAVSKNWKWGYINTRGEFVVEPQFEWFNRWYRGAMDFSEGLAAVKKNGLWGYINTRGDFVIEPQFECSDGWCRYAKPFSEGLAAVYKNGNWGYINKLGQFVIEFGSGQPFSEGLAAVWENRKWGYINAQGEFIIEPQFDNVEDFSEGLAAIKKNGLWGYINTSGKIVVEPQFDDAWSFSQGLAKVKKDGKYGYVNSLGEIVLKPQFDDYTIPPYRSANHFSEGLQAVMKNNKVGYINTSGEIVIEPQFDNIYGYWFPPDFSDGLAFVSKNSIRYFIDPTGETVFVPCQK